MSEELDPKNPPDNVDDADSTEGESTPFVITLPDDPASDKDWYLWAAVLAIFCLVAFWPAIQGAFLWDDDHYVSMNLALRSWSGFVHIWAPPILTVQYYPLTYTTFWIEWHLWGNNPLGYHIINLLLHAGSAVLVWRILRRLSVPGAWVAAALWAVHPLQVESVDWISERKNVLSGVLFFGSLWFYLKFAGIWEQDEPEAQAKVADNWPAYALSFVLFASALLAKTVVCSLPVVLLLILWWKRRLARETVLGLIPYFILGIALAGVTRSMETSPTGSVLAFGPDWDLSFVQRLLIAGRGAWFYVGKLFYPAGLAFNYPRVIPDPSDALQWLPVAGAAGVVVIAAALQRWLGRGPLVAVLFYGVALFPSLGFFDVYPFRFSFVADHFQYLAGLGIIALTMGLLAGVLRKLSPPRVWAESPVADAGPRGRSISPMQGLAAVLAGGLVVVLAATSWSRAGLFMSSDQLWIDTLDKSKNPDSWLATFNLAISRARQIDVDMDLASAAARENNQNEYATWVEDAIEQAERSTSLFKNVLADRHAPDTMKYLSYNGLGSIELRRSRFPESNFVECFNNAAAQYQLSIDGEIANNIKVNNTAPDATPYLSMGMLQLEYAHYLDRQLPPLTTTRPANATMPTGPARLPTTYPSFAIDMTMPATRPALEAETQIMNKAMEAADYLTQAVAVGNAAWHIPRLSQRAIQDMGLAEFNRGEAHFLLAALAQRRHDQPERDRQTIAASLDYYNSLKIDPANVNANYQLALCLEAFNRLDDARYYILRALDLSPANFNPQAFNVAGRIMAKRASYTGSMDDMLSAVNSFKAAIQQAPNFAEAQENLAMAQVQLKRHPAFDESLDLALHPSDDQALSFSAAHFIPF